MDENKVVAVVGDTLSALAEDDQDQFSPPLFKTVIENNVPPWTSIKNFPAVAIAVGGSEYKATNYGSTQVTTQLTIYVYNKYRTVAQSLPDIISYPIKRVRAAINELQRVNGSNIMKATVISSTRDNGTVQPYTIAELVADVTFIEETSC